MKYAYSAKNNAFYFIDWKVEHINNGTWPDDARDISDSVYLEYSRNPPIGKVLSHSSIGMPTWSDTPKLTAEEEMLENEHEKQNLIDDANLYINRKQWPGKAAIGRLKGDDLTQYNLWLDYLDALELIDTSNNEISWPESPSR